MGLVSAFFRTPHVRLPILCALTTVISSWLNVALMVVLWLSHDVVWGSSFVLIIIFSTLLNLFSTNKGGVNYLWPILQLKPLTDTLSVLNDLQNSASQKKISRFARKLFFASFQSLPASFLITYILMVEMHSRLSRGFLVPAIAFSVLSFALCTTHVAAVIDSVGTKFVVFVLISSQFLLRNLAVCAICVRFGAYGVAVMFLLWIVVYSCGPMGLRTVFMGDWKTQHVSCCKQFPWLQAFGKSLLTPLTFFLVIQIQKNCVRACDCFRDHIFLTWRIIENLVMLVLFMTLPFEVRGEDQYIPLLADPINVSVVGSVLLVLSVVSWVAVNRMPIASYDPQIDLGSNNRDSV